MSDPSSAADASARFIRDSIPAGGLFQGATWRISPEPFRLGESLAKEFESLGRVLLQFYRAVNLLYRRSVEGSAPAWVAEVLDRGKPPELIALQRDPALKNEIPRVIRPDVLLSDEGFAISELDSVPGGIGLTHWLNQTYAASPSQSWPVIGGAMGMRDGFVSIFGKAKRVHLVVSEESASYRPEMIWLAQQIQDGEFSVRNTDFTEFAPGDAVYRFFELFDLAQVPNSGRIFELARAKQVRVTPPPKPIFEEKLLFALLWNRNLREFWRQELGEGFYLRLLKHVPRTWVIDPTPLPPNAAYPGLELTDWRQLKGLSQRERELILKVSGYSPVAWGARGVYLGSDLNTSDWSVAVEQALAGWSQSPYVLQRFHRPRIVDSTWYDFASNTLQSMPGRVRLCPYYFVSGDGEAARAKLGGVLATIVPADKKIVHGMNDGILVPCVV
ncbi:MAG TPA: hypothetical protein PLX89_10655 [Verrucomicrobiota bacterium]|nr:hypothetical protein [Verrucomicrobiales bacterium]HRI13456.1 hypothetical protein [Verrucomicrobiota bacterium]